MENKAAPSWTANEANDEPTSFDILCGKDSTSICHIGNRCFRALVGFGIEEFKALSSQTEKYNFTNSIIQSIRISGARFLRRQPNGRGWEQVDPKVTKEKVRHAFQDALIRRRKRPNIRKDDISPVIKPYYNTAGHFDWKGIVMNAESASRACPPPLEVIYEPTNLDILHGRDDVSVRHIGNVCFRTVIGYSVVHYVILSTRLEKAEFLGAIVNAIHNSGGRFLHRRPHGRGWEQDDIHIAKQTVGSAFRTVIKKPKGLHNSSLIDESDIFRYYKTAYDFDWGGMVTEAQRLVSERKNPSASFTDYRNMDSFRERQDIPSSASRAAPLWQHSWERVQHSERLFYPKSA
jgi:hypothetical protein